jgi:cation transport protein ChaC
MSLTREDLESGLPRRLWNECGGGQRALTDEELEASLACMLSGAPGGEDVWVFGYGSLMWNPLFHFAERRPATLRGFHRSFCLRSIVGRGTPERPGLMLALDNGGSCRGLAFRLAATAAAQELKLLWRREMVVGSYIPRWARVEADPCPDSHGCAEELRVLTFVVNHENSNYLGRLPFEQVASMLATAHGRIGSGADYLYQTVDALSAHGLRDGYVERLRDRVVQALEAD